MIYYLFKCDTKRLDFILYELYIYIWYTVQHMNEKLICRKINTWELKQRIIFHCRFFQQPRYNDEFPRTCSAGLYLWVLHTGIQSCDRIRERDTRCFRGMDVKTCYRQLQKWKKEILITSDLSSKHQNIKLLNSTRISRTSTGHIRREPYIFIR